MPAGRPTLHDGPVTVTLEEARGRLDGFAAEHADLPDGMRRAAVSVVVADPGPGLGVWIQRRPSTLRAHGGQWAFPGGRLEPGETAVQAALRELHEELGVTAGPGAIIGRLDDYVTRSGYVITPFVLWLGEHHEPLDADPEEIAYVRHVPLAEVDVEPRFVRIPESDRPVIQVPVLGGLLHAPTGAVLHQFREVVLRGRHTRVQGYEQPVFAWR